MEKPTNKKKTKKNIGANFIMLLAKSEFWVCDRGVRSNDAF